MIKVTESPLKLIEIKSLEHSVKTIANSDDDRVILEDSIIKVDFDKQYNNKNDDFFRLCLKLSISPPRKRKGYKISCLIHGYFYIQDRKSAPSSNGLENSALAMVISYSRSYLKTLTYNCPYGTYILPSFDMQELVSKKLELLKKELDKEIAKNKTKTVEY